MKKLLILGAFVFGSLALAQAQNTPSQAPSTQPTNTQVAPAPSSPGYKVIDNKPQQNNDVPPAKHAQPTEGAQRKEEQPSVNTPSNSTNLNTTTPAHTQPVKKVDTGTAPKK